jgi:hypothetical protein
VDTLPPNANLYIPVLIQEYKGNWNKNPVPSSLGAQVEQETCPSLKARGCWSPYAHLKTDREEGIGLGQATRTAKFDILSDLKKKYPSKFEGWSWDSPYNASYQLRALVLMDKECYSKLRPLAITDQDGLAFAYSCYNGGLGGVLNDRKLCSTIEGCNPGVWFYNVADHSYKSNKKSKGYGQSFREINRGYVNNLINVRRPKYDSIFIKGLKD